MRRLILPLLLASPLLLAGCDMLGIESASQIAAHRDAEGKAVGGACRYSGRAIEDCFAQNRKVDKAAIFAGWREMNDYMRDNKIDSPSPTATASSNPADAASGDAAQAAKPVAKDTAKTRS